jgi:branched-chain amino acid transport system permease protein
MAAPILSVEPGMGDNLLILAFVVIVIGGIGSIRGAFIAALLVGLVDTLGAPSGRPAAAVPVAVGGAAGRAGHRLHAPSTSLMAAILAFRPAGLFPAKGAS